jgi:hypothetical protein
VTSRLPVLEDQDPAADPSGWAVGSFGVALALLPGEALLPGDGEITIKK